MSKVVFGDDGEAVVKRVMQTLNIKPKNTVQKFEELKVVSSNKKKSSETKEKREKRETRIEKTRVGTKDPPAPPRDVKPKKPLPPDYKCNACGAVGEHAIYDCAEHISKKKKKKATKEKSSDGNDSTSTASGSTVFISGLPFDMDIPKLKEYLRENGGCDEGIQKHNGINIVPMEDNPKKCRGIAFVAFETAEQAQSCISAIHNKQLKSKSISASIAVVKEKPNYGSPGKSAGFNRKKHDPSEKNCYRCGGKHDAATCTADRICYRCKSTEHISSACPKKKTPTSITADSAAASSAEPSADGKKKRGWGKESQDQDGEKKMSSKRSKAAAGERDEFY